MTTNAAEKLAADAAKDDAHKDKDKDKEKVEKRRALGRGLESLLPGPRVVTAPAPKQVAHVLAPIVIQARVESAAEPAEAELGSAGQPRAGVPPQTAAASHPMAGVPSKSPLLAKDARTGAPMSVADPEGNETITNSAQAESRMPGNLVVNLDIADIDKNPFQTRYVQDDGALEELADSIRANGVVQPIMVRPSEEEGRYILVLGERRLHASKKAGKTAIPALVRRVSLQQAAEMTIIENLQREDLSALEQAESFRVLSNEFKMTQQQIGERVGLSRTSVTNYMRLLKLPREVMQLLAEKKLSFAEAKELLALENDDQISKAALYAVKKGLTLEQIERLVLSMNGDLDPFPGMPGQVVKKSGARWVDPNVRAAQLDMERMLGVRVRIRDRKGKGKIVIEYANVDDYERVVGMLQGKK
jgi:ParB family transcriptional regulator, chromosome partitioning protein